MCMAVIVVIESITLFYDDHFENIFCIEAIMSFPYHCVPKNAGIQHLAINNKSCFFFNV